MPGKVEDALKVAAAFDPVVRAVISSTPPGALISSDSGSLADDEIQATFSIGSSCVASELRNFHF